MLKDFGNLKKVHSIDIFTTEEKQCEELRKKSHKRESDGRYVVRLPFKMKCNELIDSKSIAVSACKAMRRFN